MVHFKRLLLLVALVAFITATPVLAQASGADEVHLIVIELKLAHGKGPARPAPDPIPTEDNSMTNPDYKLLRYHWPKKTTIAYSINPSSSGLTGVVTAIKDSAETWDKNTAAEVFNNNPGDGTGVAAGTYDGCNVVAWGPYKEGVIAVTYIWYNIITKYIVETDTLMNTLYAWSLLGEEGKFDVQNIMTHEFGHWAGLADLYGNADYWLTMYGYAGYGETWKQTLGLGDILGLQAWYGT